MFDKVKDALFQIAKAIYTGILYIIAFIFILMILLYFIQMLIIGIYCFIDTALLILMLAIYLIQMLIAGLSYIIDFIINSI